MGAVVLPSLNMSSVSLLSNIGFTEVSVSTDGDPSLRKPYFPSNAGLSHSSLFEASTKGPREEGIPCAENVCARKILSPPGPARDTIGLPGGVDAGED